MNIIDIMKSPLTQTGETGPFLRLVLAECASYGMPQQVIASLDDIAAMLGFYEPLPIGQAGHLAGPFSTWRSDRRQPTHERITEVEGLALKQRALIAFGGAPEDHRIGTAEIIVAMGNTHKEICPPDYYDIFRWATVDVLKTLQNRSAEDVRKEKGYPVITDDEVLKPGGRLYATYIDMVTYIRRVAISALKGDPQSPREVLRPLAAHFIRLHTNHLQEAQQAGDQDLARRITRAIETIRGMYPGLVVEDAPLVPAPPPAPAD